MFEINRIGFHGMTVFRFASKSVLVPYLFIVLCECCVPIENPCLI